jgi:hypothetical protein
MNQKPEVSLCTIEAAAKLHSLDRENLTSVVTELNTAIESLKAQALKQIKRAVAKAAESKSILTAEIDAGRHLFIRPRTVIFHGLECGLKKGRGTIDWDDDEKTSALILKHFPDQAEVLVKTTHKPRAKALQGLAVADLKRIGCTVETTGDLIIINPVDTAVDKLVEALLRDATDDAQSESQEAA